MTCRSTALRISADEPARRPPRSTTPPTRGPDEVHAPTPPTLTSPHRPARPRWRCAAHTRAVASLTSDSPSSIVTTRRGRPIRRAMAVAATASGGATTAPSANAAANGHRQQPPGHQPDAERGEEHQPDREQPDRRPVGLEVHQRAADRGGIQQRRQQPDQHDLGGQVHLGDERQERAPPRPTSVSSSGADRSNRRASPATAVTVATRARAVIATVHGEVLAALGGSGRAPVSGVSPGRPSAGCPGRRRRCRARGGGTP